MESFLQQDLLNPEELRIVKFGTFWPRFWALLIDALVLAILSPVTIYNETEWKSSTLMIAIVLIQIGYKSFFEYQYGATPGKMAMNLKVVNYQFEKASLQEILLRNIFQITAGIFSIGRGLYLFHQPGFFAASTIQQFGALDGERIMGIVFLIYWLVICITDVIFLLNSKDSRSLHDRIGRTFVIKV
jgi:uncharacterized RDD family membrane protein YckC